jgi:selenide,water dikinase
LPVITDPNVLVGPETRDDAGVYLINESTALVVTTDFFTPVLDDAFDFGRVAAANALSDIWACGGKPILALNIVGFPRSLPMELLGEVLRGGAEVAGEAGISIIGGHSIDDAEPKYGLVVVGVVNPDRILRNVGARAGDTLILTKPLGSGIVTTAIKRGLASEGQISEITELMATLNKSSGELFIENYNHVRALTDVTGFGLLGHLFELLDASNVAATLNFESIKFIPSAVEFVGDGVCPGGTKANLKANESRVDFGGISEESKLLLADAQTSGGLLASVDPAESDRILQELRSRGVDAFIIGEVTGDEPSVKVV